MKQKKLKGVSTSFDMSIGDIMASLLLIFILLLVSTLFKIQKDYELKSNIAQDYRRTQMDIINDLSLEFSKDLEEWGAEIDPKTMSIRFKNQDQLFSPNRADLRPAFMKTLNDFFPRYINVLYPKYADILEEIRIEGHTAQDKSFSYLDHMELSQARTNAVLQYILGTSLTNMDPLVNDWVCLKISASGLAYSKLIVIDGKVNPELSRRVEFRLRTNSEEKIEEFLELDRDH